MSGIITLVFAVVVVLVIGSAVGFITHFLFSPWLLLVAAVAALAWFKFRTRRSRR